MFSIFSLDSLFFLYPQSHGGRQPMCDPEGCATVLGPVGGGGGGLVGTPTYIPQNDPHDALIVLIIHKWGEKFSKENCASTQAPICQVRPGGRVGVKILFCAFQPFLNSPQNSEYFEYGHIRSTRKMCPCHMPKTNSPALPAPTKPIVLYNHFGVCRAPPPLLRSPPPLLRSGPDQDRPPCHNPQICADVCRGPRCPRFCPC